MFLGMSRKGIRTGIIGGRFGYFLLRRIGHHAEKEGYCSGSACLNQSKLEVLLGPQIWVELSGKVVIDFGCGLGKEVIEIAQRGGKRVIGVDIRSDVIEVARLEAEKASLTDRCVFVTHTSEKADVVLSTDGFEHFGDPA